MKRILYDSNLGDVPAIEFHEQRIGPRGRTHARTEFTYKGVTYWAAVRDRSHVDTLTGDYEVFIDVDDVEVYQSTGKITDERDEDTTSLSAGCKHAVVLLWSLIRGEGPDGMDTYVIDKGNQLWQTDSLPEGAPFNACDSSGFGRTEPWTELPYRGSAEERLRAYCDQQGRSLVLKKGHMWRCAQGCRILRASTKQEACHKMINKLMCCGEWVEPYEEWSSFYKLLQYVDKYDCDFTTYKDDAGRHIGALRTGSISTHSRGVGINAMANGIIEELKEEGLWDVDDGVSLPDLMDGKCVLIMRGVSGSGKTTIAESINQYIGAEICSADAYRYKDGEYQWSKEMSEEAHRKCFEQFCTAIEDGVSRVIVDNTNTRPWELAPYVAYGQSHDYRVIIVEVGREIDASVCTHRGRHDVPLWVVQSMKERMEEPLPEKFAELVVQCNQYGYVESTDEEDE